MKLKTENGAAVLQDGKPVYLTDDGQELALDAAGLYEQVRKLTGENRDHRKAREEAEAKLKSYAAIDDPDAAAKALETVKGLDGKIKADIERVRAEVSKSYEAKLAEVTKQMQATEQALHRELIGGGVARSKFVAERSALPADLLLAAIGNGLTVENGTVVGKRADGSPIYSRANPGQLAGLDEVLETLVSESPHRDHLMRATQKSGSGAAPGSNGAPPQQRTMARSAFEALSPAERVDVSKAGVQLTD